MRCDGHHLAVITLPVLVVFAYPTTVAESHPHQAFARGTAKTGSRSPGNWSESPGRLPTSCRPFRDRFYGQTPRGPGWDPR
jgi:hypothetical protein